jgi:hypothetical protein
MVKRCPNLDGQGKHHWLYRENRAWVKAKAATTKQTGLIEQEYLRDE